MKTMHSARLATLCSFLLFMSMMPASAQENATAGLPLRVGGYISPDAGMLWYDYNNPYDWEMGLSGALRAEYLLYEHIHLQAGLQYAYRDSEFDMVGRSDYDGSYLLFGQRDQFHYLGIPVEVKAFLFKRRFSVYASLGHLVDFKLKRFSSSYYTNDQALYLLEGFSPSRESEDVVFSIMGNIGIEYSIGNKYAVFFEPGIMYSYTNVCDPDAVNPNTGVDSRPYKFLAYQFRFGCIYQL